MANRLEQTAEKNLCNRRYLIEIADASVAGCWHQAAGIVKISRSAYHEIETLFIFMLSLSSDACAYSRYFYNFFYFSIIFNRWNGKFHWLTSMNQRWWFWFVQLLILDTWYLIPHQTYNCFLLRNQIKYFAVWANEIETH